MVAFATQLISIRPHFSEELAQSHYLAFEHRKLQHQFVRHFLRQFHCGLPISVAASRGYALIYGYYNS